MLGGPEAAANTGRLFPGRELGGDRTVAEPEPAAIGNLGVRIAQWRELGGDRTVTEPEPAAIGNLGVRMAQWRELGGGFIDRHHDGTPIELGGWFSSAVSKVPSFTEEMIKKETCQFYRNYPFEEPTG
jgi:hypothetical protein